jgi:hypothetical protein
MGGAAGRHGSRASGTVEQHGEPPHCLLQLGAVWSVGCCWQTPGGCR